MRIITIGGYGFAQDTFLAALKGAGVDTFADLRQRRGLRGKQYAFLNSTRLQASLVAAGIRYVHLSALAPPSEVRDVQRRQDAIQGDAKRSREALSPDFIDEYRRKVLAGYSASDFIRDVGVTTSAVALFCVERTPSACHRSIVAHHLGTLLDVVPEDLLP